MPMTNRDFETLKREAISGDMDAQCALADIYADDTQIDFFDVDEAVFWYDKSAKQGHTRAQWLLGACYSQGIGVEKDAEKAEHWLLKSAQSGDAEGQYSLGGFYFMKPDIVKAEYWIGKAADNGHVEARTTLEAVKRLLEV